MGNLEYKIELLLRQCSFWSHLNDGDRQKILRKARIQAFKKGQLIDSNHPSCLGIAFLISGGLKISIISNEGKEIVLFKLKPGDCCVTTASCIVRQITFDTLVTTTQQTTLLVIPPCLCKHLIANNIYFKCFVYEIEVQRYSKVVWDMQELLFKRLDQRVASYLFAACLNTGSLKIKCTHEQIAEDINSTREPVTRTLDRFSKQGLISLSRGSITLIDVSAIKRIGF